MKTVISIPRRQVVAIAAAPVGLALFLAITAMAQWRAGQAGLEPVLLLGGSATCLALVMRVAAARVSVDEGSIRVEGLLRGYSLDRQDIAAVVEIRRSFGRDGLALKMKSGQNLLLPPVLYDRSTSALESVRQRLSRILNDSSSEPTD